MSRICVCIHVHLCCTLRNSIVPSSFSAPSSSSSLPHNYADYEPLLCNDSVDSKSKLLDVFVIILTNVCTVLYGYGIVSGTRVSDGRRIRCASISCVSCAKTVYNTHIRVCVRVRAVFVIVVQRVSVRSRAQFE